MDSFMLRYMKFSVFLYHEGYHKVSTNYFYDPKITAYQFEHLKVPLASLSY